jgi:molecular chaperone GrpE
MISEEPGKPKEEAPATNGAAAPDKELEAAKAELKEQQTKYLYLYAEFENYKKRTFKERSDLVKFGHEAMTRELLQVADNLDRALEHANETDALVTGVKLVRQQLSNILERYGVGVVKAVGEKFNPEQHEAVGQEKLPADKPDAVEGVITKELQKGYTLHGRLLRPARVVVAIK